MRAQFGDNYLLNNNSNDPLYYKFNFYQIPTDFEYAGLNSDLGGGWRFEDKVYSNRYYNHQQYNNGTSITTTSARCVWRTASGSSRVVPDVYWNIAMSSAVVRFSAFGS